MSSNEATQPKIPLLELAIRRLLEGFDSSESVSKRERLLLACGRHLTRIAMIWVILGYVGRRSILGAVVVYLCMLIYRLTLPPRER